MADQAAEAMALPAHGDSAGEVAGRRERKAPEPPAAPDPAESPVAWQATSARLLQEMQEMRALLASEKAHRVTAGCCREGLERHLAAAGFSRTLADELLAALPEELREAGPNDARAAAWLERQLVARLGDHDAGTEILDRTGILALVGPTGVGKTTTTAKLAARYVIRHGRERVALITTDAFRIGAREQLEIYAGLLGIPMYALGDGMTLEELLARLHDKAVVIIDTVGMSQRDQRIIEQVARLHGGDRPVNLMLLLNAASQPETLEEVITNFRQAARAAGADLSDCLLTKEDEAGRLGPLLDAVIRHGLRLGLVAHGQRVPEDLSPASPQALVARALETGSRLLASGSVASPVPAPGDRSRGLLGQGRRLGGILATLRQHVEGFPALESVADLTLLPSPLQGGRLDELLVAERSKGTAEGILWSPRQRVRGCDWSLPDIALQAGGGWQALPSLQHRQPPCQLARLAEATTALGARRHLLPLLPDAETLAWLEAGGHTWLARARGAQRLVHREERLALSQLRGLAVDAGEVGCRFRGEPASLSLSSLAVSLSPPKARRGSSPAPGVALKAWFGTLHGIEGGRLLGRACWLAPARLSGEIAPLLIEQWQGDALAGLTRHAWKRLKETHPETAPEVRLLMAAGLAAVASRLDLTAADWAMDSRAELLGLLGGRRQRTARALLEGMLYLFVARDTIRQLGGVGRDGRRP